MLELPISFQTGAIASNDTETPSWWFICEGSRLLVRDASDAPQLPRGNHAPLTTSDAPLYLGLLAGVPCFALGVSPDTTLPAGYQLLNLRQLFGVLDDELTGVAGQALQLVQWDWTHRFCGVCANPTVRGGQDRSRVCTECGYSSYPRLSPAIMVRILRGDEILLARSPRFPEGMFSVLAGFVDPGESLEQTVHREVAEEVGLEVANLRYLCSQSWPFPHSLMIAFSADYQAGEICIDDDEIVEAAWFRRHTMPMLPGRISIARWLIDDYLRAGN